MHKIKQILPQDNKFTEVLCHLAYAPKMLYYYGILPENRQKTVAIVGSRRSTRYGEDIAYKLGYELAKRGVIVVSGMAFGIDAASHRGAVEAGGTTIAVLGTAIDNLYPKANIDLARKILDTGGVIMSEYERGMNVFTKSSFLERNRIISGLSDAVVVVEAAIKSGSLNTAAHALDQNKQVFAVPGNINNPYSQGCNKLIKQGAEPVTEIKDVVEYFFPEEFAKKKKNDGQLLIFGDTEVETKILRAMTEGIFDGDEIMEKMKIPAGDFSQTVTMLEIKGRIKGLGANKWVLT